MRVLPRWNLRWAILRNPPPWVGPVVLAEDLASPSVTAPVALVEALAVASVGGIDLGPDALLLIDLLDLIAAASVIGIDALIMVSTAAP